MVRDAIAQMSKLRGGNTPRTDDGWVFFLRRVSWWSSGVVLFIFLSARYEAPHLWGTAGGKCCIYIPMYITFLLFKYSKDAIRALTS